MEGDGLRLAHHAEAWRLLDHDLAVLLRLRAGDKAVQRAADAALRGVLRRVVNLAVGDHHGAGKTFWRNVGESAVQHFESTRTLVLVARIGLHDDGSKFRVGQARHGPEQQPGRHHGAAGHAAQEEQHPQGRAGEVRLVQADHRGERLGRRPQAARAHLQDRARHTVEGDLRMLVGEAVRLLEHRHHRDVGLLRVDDGDPLQGLRPHRQRADLVAFHHHALHRLLHDRDPGLCSRAAFIL